MTTSQFSIETMGLTEECQKLLYELDGSFGQLEMDDLLGPWKEIFEHFGLIDLISGDDICWEFECVSDVVIGLGILCLTRLANSFQVCMSEVVNEKQDEWWSNLISLAPSVVAIKTFENGQSKNDDAVESELNDHDEGFSLKFDDINQLYRHKVHLLPECLYTEEALTIEFKTKNPESYEYLLYKDFLQRLEKDKYNFYMQMPMILGNVTISKEKDSHGRLLHFWLLLTFPMLSKNNSKKKIVTARCDTDCEAGCVSQAHKCFGKRMYVSALNRSKGGKNNGHGSIGLWQINELVSDRGVCYV